MLEQLRRVTQAVNQAESQQAKLDVIVSQICESLSVNCCSIFLADYQIHQFVLMATRGLSSSGVGQVKLSFNEGLVGLVGQREEPIHVKDMKSHPSYRHFENIDEEKYNAFLGVPIIHQRKVLGVIIILQEESREFELDEETFLITLAAQLSSILSISEISDLFDSQSPDLISRTIPGVAASPGVAVGQARVVFPIENIHSIPDRKTDDIPSELEKLGAAVKKVHRQLERMSRKMTGKVSEQELSLFSAYQQILGSKGLSAEVEEVVNQGYWAATALRKVIQKHLNEFKLMQDPYLRERANDIEDLANRVLAELLKTGYKPQKLASKTIVVAENFTAAMLAELSLSEVVGVVSLKGSSTSHAAILAKALGVPAIMGVESCPLTRIDGKQMILDGYNGQLYVSPNAALVRQYEKLIAEEELLNQELSRDDKKTCSTRDGQSVKLMINSSLGTDQSRAKLCGAEGVGLYRTEIPFMQLEQFPSEDVQVCIYRDILQEFEDCPVTIRTLDIGGDKQLDYFPINEDNPFLGWRGVRVTLDHPEIFLVQLRAIFKASVGFLNLKIAIPMVSTVEELDESLRLFKQAFEEVKEELGEEASSLVFPQIGIILEIPGAVYQLANFASKIDFISVGTNDLIQYTMAVDRNNFRVKNLYSHFQPAVLAMLKNIEQTCRSVSLSPQICGEMAADPLAAILLTGMGFRELSMNIGSLAKVKRAISRFDACELTEIAERAMALDSAAKIKDMLLKEIEERGLGGLVRAGN